MQWFHSDSPQKWTLPFSAHHGASRRSGGAVERRHSQHFARDQVEDSTPLAQRRGDADSSRMLSLDCRHRYNVAPPKHETFGLQSHLTRLHTRLWTFSRLFSCISTYLNGLVFPGESTGNQWFARHEKTPRVSCKLSHQSSGEPIARGDHEFPKVPQRSPSAESLVNAEFLLVGGDWLPFFGIFPLILGICHHPNWRTIFFRGVQPQPPTRLRYTTNCLRVYNSREYCITILYNTNT